MSGQVIAQPAGQLYDPEPPADSAYVRLLVVQHDAAIELLVDGRARAAKLTAGEVSDYMVLTAGKHTLTLKSMGKSPVTLTHSIDVVSGRAMTLAFSGLKADVKPTLFEDKANTNKLKSLIAAYHLDGKAGAVNVVTADGATKVFSNLAYGTSNAIQVNPISVELVAAKVGDQTPPGGALKAALSMTAGANYSVFLMPNAQGVLMAKAVQNKTERYAGK
jgi:alginate O-acetyltransferase complex protein AlgF